MTAVFTPSEYARWLGRLGGRMDSAVRRGLVVASMRVLPVADRATKRAEPASEHGSVGAVNYGIYRRAWQTEVTPGRLAVYNRTAYAGVIEYGRRAGTRMPPRDAIARWAQRKLGLAESDARTAAFVMARAIARRGLRARRVLGGAVQEMGDIVREELSKSFARTLEAKGGA